ncbi:unnamed protein product [Auanema sp. JU1783]|nr:unnamed protein product [Auanema sp. JU1783]
MWTVSLEGGPRRVNHAAVAIGDNIYSFGGYCSGEPMDAENPIDIHVLNARTYRWRLLKAREPDYGVNSDSSIQDGDVENSVHDEETGNYGYSSFPYQRYGHTVVVYKDKAYLWGGRNDESGAINVLHEFDPKTLTWRIVPVTGTVPPARDGHSAIVVGDKMYMFGGFEEDAQRFSQETYVYDFETSHWSKMRTNGFPPLWRDFHTAVGIGNMMYVFGGRSDQMGQYHSTRDVYCDRLKALDLSTGEWVEPVVKGDRPSGRRSHSAWAYNGKMYIFGGFLGTKNEHYNDLYCYDPATCSWSKIKAPGLLVAPSPRRRQCTVVVGDRVFLFGGTMPLTGQTTGLVDLSDLHVFDYAPSLFLISAQSLIRSGMSNSAQPYLPRDIIQQIRLLTTNNTISNPPVTRHEVSHLMGFYLAVASAFLPFSYVGFLHLADKDGTNRNDPGSVKKRCIGAIACCIFSLFITYVILKHTGFDAPWSLMGFRKAGLFNALLYPTILINLLYAGQWLFFHYEGYFNSFFSYRNWKNSFEDVCWLRDAFLAPVTEEITFRACSSVLLDCYFSNITKTVAVAPLFFAFSHLHHIGDDVRRGLSLQRALLRRGFQCLYTYVFGLYSTYLFLSTRQIVAPIITHSICNTFGLPLLSEINTFPDASTRLKLWIVFIGGMLSFIVAFKPLTNSHLYQ